MTQTWSIPIELAKEGATATGKAAIIKAICAGARFKPSALVFVRAGRIVADLPFVTPLGPEAQDGVTVILCAPLEENAEVRP
jgi:hypothetical protein